MRVTDIQLRRLPESLELSADVDGQRLWYRFQAGYAVSTRGDAFVAAVLLQAMSKGEPLEIDASAPVSPMFLGRVGQLQEIFHHWNPALQRIAIMAKEEAAPHDRTGSLPFFSGGVDSIYTFLRHADEISHLAYIRWFDIGLENTALRDAATQHNQRFADAFGKTLIPVDTNLRNICFPNSPISLTTYHACMLATVGLALGFPKCFIPASHTYEELFPWASHPLTDPLWSNEATRFSHDGAEAKRTEKMRVIAANSVARDILRVCWSSPSDGYNCGYCDKCLLARITLRILQIDLPGSPPLQTTRLLKQLRVKDRSDLTFYEDNLALAEATGDDEIADALRRCIFRYRTRRVLGHADRMLFGARLRGLAIRLIRRKNAGARSGVLPGKVSFDAEWQ
jgi:hypothetical protein